MKFEDFKIDVGYKVISYTDDIWKTRKGEPGVFSVGYFNLYDYKYEIFIWGNVEKDVQNRSYYFKTKKAINASLNTIVAEISKETGEEMIQFCQNKIDGLKKDYEID